MSKDPKRPPVMVAGIGGASLGTEILKCLKLAGWDQVFGCDVSPTAYGLYLPGFVKTFCVNRAAYVEDVLQACADTGARWIIPGGEQPTTLLGGASAALAKAGVTLVGNTPDVIETFSNKEVTFQRLAALGVPVPRTAPLDNASTLDAVGLPCIIKPATGSGGSVSVFFATSRDEAMTYADFIRRSGAVPLAQQYVGVEEGEFTVGVLSLPDQTVAGSIALRRVLDAKLSVSYRGRGGVVSSGYSQGLIDHFPDICAQAEFIARRIDSRGPINIQGRVSGGVLLPFEINPRFSASTYLRAMAGFNEVEVFLDHLVTGRLPSPRTIKTGYYLRTLAEAFVPLDELRRP